MLNQPHEHYNEKNEAILHLDSLYKNSTYLGPLISKTDADYDSYLFETKIAGKSSWIIVKKTDGESRFTIYSISDQPRLKDFVKKEKGT